MVILKIPDKKKLCTEFIHMETIQFIFFVPNARGKQDHVCERKNNENLTEMNNKKKVMMMMIVCNLNFKTHEK